MREELLALKPSALKKILSGKKGKFVVDGIMAKSFQPGWLLLGGALYLRLALGKFDLLGAGRARFEG